MNMSQQTPLLGCPDCGSAFGELHLTTCPRVAGHPGPGRVVATISPGPLELLADLRAAGWRVAAHNDYEYKGQLFTFWLFTHRAGGVYAKGEGATDLDALREAISDIKRRDLTYVEERTNANGNHA